MTLVKATTTRGVVKSRLIERLEGKFVEQKIIPALTTSAAKKKDQYRQHWLAQTMPDTIKDIGYCVESLLYLSNQEIADHQENIRSVMLKLFINDYEKASYVDASNIRKAICRIDEALYMEN